MARKPKLDTEPTAEPTPAKTTVARKKEEPVVLVPHRFAGTDHSVPCSECKQGQAAHIHFR